MTHKIGGMMGFGNQTATTRVVINQNEYYPGEKLKVTLHYDGKKCDKPVKSFKFKLFRLMTHRCSLTGQETTKI
jgi:sporulation-control protein spo0M